MCTKLNGTATFKPPLPKLASAKKLKPTVTIKGAKLAGCTGGGVTGGTVAATMKFGAASNCTTLAEGAPTNTKGTVTVAWSNKRTSTVSATLKAVAGKMTLQTLAGKIAAGQFKGSKLSATTEFVIAGGQCTAQNLSTVPFALARGAKLTVK
jgi:hypothetical protein